MNEDNLAYTKWDCTYLIVWIPKYRKKTLYGENKKELIEIIRHLLSEKRLGLFLMIQKKECTYEVKNKS